MADNETVYKLEGDWVEAAGFHRITESQFNLEEGGGPPRMKTIYVGVCGAMVMQVAYEPNGERIGAYGCKHGLWLNMGDGAYELLDWGTALEVLYDYKPPRVAREAALRASGLWSLQQAAWAGEELRALEEDLPPGAKANLAAIDERMAATHSLLRSIIILTWQTELRGGPDLLPRKDRINAVLAQLHEGLTGIQQEVEEGLREGS